MVATLWDKVTPTTLENCFKKVGFLMQEDEDDDFGDVDDDNTSAMREVWDIYSGSGGSITG